MSKVSKKSAIFPNGKAEWSKAELIAILTDIAYTKYHLSLEQFVESVNRHTMWCECRDYRDLLRQAGLL
jgi:hypothetical protein